MPMIDLISGGLKRATPHPPRPAERRIGVIKCWHWIVAIAGAIDCPFEPNMQQSAAGYTAVPGGGGNVSDGRAGHSTARLRHGLLILHSPHRVWSAQSITGWSDAGLDRNNTMSCLGTPLNYKTSTEETDGPYADPLAFAAAPGGGGIARQARGKHILDSDRWVSAIARLFWSCRTQCQHDRRWGGGTDVLQLVRRRAGVAPGTPAVWLGGTAPMWCFDSAGGSLALNLRGPG